MDWQDRESPGGHKMSRLVFGMFWHSGWKPPKMSHWNFHTKTIVSFHHQKWKIPGEFFSEGTKKTAKKGKEMSYFWWFSNTVISFRFTRKVLYKRVNITLNKLFGAAVIISHNRWEWEKRKQGHPVVITVQLFAHLLTLIKVRR